MWAIIKKREGEELEALLNGWEPFAVVVVHYWNQNISRLDSTNFIYLRKEKPFE